MFARLHGFCGPNFIHQIAGQLRVTRPARSVALQGGNGNAIFLLTQGFVAGQQGD